VNAQRFTKRIETVTVDPVVAWLNRTGLGDAVQVVRQSSAGSHELTGKL
jgi:hypothetical protein